jgi:hypothetical protein
MRQGQTTFHCRTGGETGAWGHCVESGGPRLLLQGTHELASCICHEQCALWVKNKGNTVMLSNSTRKPVKSVLRTREEESEVVQQVVDNQQPTGYQ